jgi:transmembrane sensor
MDDLLIKYLLAEASPDERIRVELWLDADAANHARFEQFKAVWAISRQTAATPVPQDTQAAWKELRQRLNRSTNGARATTNGARATTPLWRIAAVFAGILLLGAGGYLVLTKAVHRATSMPVAIAPPSTSPVEETFPTARQPQTITLPDQSVVTLNRHSLLSYSKSEAQGLTVHLRGEAFFSIAHHPQKPFVVQVNDLRIKVLGTTFEVRGATNQGAAEVIVETGAVRVTNGADSLVVQAGEKIIVQPNSPLHKQPIRDRLYGYYLGRPLVCDSVPLRRVVEVLNEAYNAHLTIGRTELNDLPLTTVFRHNESLDRILSVIAATFDLTVVRQGQSIILQ